MLTFHGRIGQRLARGLGLLALLSVASSWAAVAPLRPARPVSFLVASLPQPRPANVADTSVRQAPRQGEVGRLGADRAVVETALTAQAAGHLADAYLLLEPLVGNRTENQAGQSAAHLLRWSAQLTQARLLIRLGAWNAARTVLPPRPSSSSVLWPEAAWQLTSAELERAAGRPQAALVAARRGARLLAHSTSAAHPLRAYGWVELALTHTLNLQLDSALLYAERTRVLMSAKAAGPGAGWAAEPAARLALPAVSVLTVYTLLVSVLDRMDPEATGPVQIGATRFATCSAAADALLDSAARPDQQAGADAVQRAGLLRVAGLHWANRALADDDEAAARRADAAFVRASRLARTPAERATIETIRGEFAGAFNEPQAALPIYRQALRHLLGASGGAAGPRPIRRRGRPRSGPRRNRARFVTCSNSKPPPTATATPRRPIPATSIATLPPPPA